MEELVNYKDILTELLSRFKCTKDELIPVMEAAQDEFGYLSPEIMLLISKYLKVPESTVYGVATFYALFRTQPSGRKKVQVCRGTACHVRGGSRVLQEVENILGIKAGETTADMEFSLDTISCFGSCALSPVIVVNKTVYGRMTPSKIENVLNTYKNTKEG
jgi:NADH-quinone oxidoreductase subunit E